MISIDFIIGALAALALICSLDGLAWLQRRRLKRKSQNEVCK